MKPAENSCQTKDLFCSVYGHNYIIDNRLTKNRYKCKCCDKSFIMSDNGDLVNEKPNFREVLSLLKFINKKRSRVGKFTSFDLA